MVAGSADGWRRRTGWPRAGCGSRCRSRRRRRSSAPDGTATVARMVHAAGGRCVGLHFGTYDYTRRARHRRRRTRRWTHPAADHAKDVMQLAAAGTGVPALGRLDQRAAGRAPPQRSGPRWALHARLVAPLAGARLLPGLGPAPGAAADPLRGHLPVLPDRAWTRPPRRLRDYLAGIGGGVLDEPATARALAGFVLRGLDCGALDDRGGRGADRGGRARRSTSSPAPGGPAMGDDLDVRAPRAVCCDGSPAASVGRATAGWSRSSRPT